MSDPANKKLEGLPNFKRVFYGGLDVQHGMLSYTPAVDPDNNMIKVSCFTGINGVTIIGLYSKAYSFQHMFYKTCL